MRYLVIMLLGMAMVHSAMQDSVTQFGITWTFDKDYEVGQFANGDWWVKGPATISSVTPGWTGSMNGAMVNPAPGGKQGFDSRNSGKYDAGLRVSFPTTLQPGQSLISAISKADYSGSWSALKGASILTAISEAQGADAFRPHYCNTAKVYHSTNNIQWHLLPKLTAPASNVPSGTDVLRKFERPWIDFDGGWSGTIIHAEDNMSVYGREIGNDVTTGALYLLLDKPEQQTLAIRFIQLGIDLYGVVKSGGGWGADGGHATGRKWPILFAGIMLDDADMKAIGTSHGGKEPGYGSPQFGEDCQTFILTQEVLDGYPGSYKNTEYYNPFPKPGDGVYGIRACQSQWPGSTRYSQGYRDCCNSETFPGFILAARAMHAENLWNHEAIFKYVDWWMDNGATRTIAFAKAMYNTYRDNLPGPVGVGGNIPLDPPSKGEERQKAEGRRQALPTNLENPVRGRLVIKTNNGADLIKVYDASGKIKMHTLGQPMYTVIEMRNIPNGVYYYQVGQGQYQKFIVTK